MTKQEYNDDLKTLYLLIKTIDKVDIDRAIQIITDPDIDTQELSDLIKMSITGTIIDKNNKAIKLSTKLVLTAIKTHKLNIDFTLDTEVSILEKELQLTN